MVNMWKVSLVGHSQLPDDLSINNAEIQIYRGPGGRADNFFEDERLNEVLNWEHDLSILWLGSNDIDNETQPRDIANNILKVVESIEENCQAVVWICLVEPRLYTNGFMMEEDYRKVQRKINKILKEKGNQVIHFNSNDWVEYLASDGIHWTVEGRKRVKSKLKKTIKNFMEDSD